MAEENRSFPMLPVAHWWTLRKKFKQSIPGVVTDSYLATVLHMEAKSARANVLPFLKILGIIDNDGKPLERAKQWRDDQHYPEVCKSILKDIYPDELLAAVPDPKPNRNMAERWFANHTGSGEAACRRMAALYSVLVDANTDGETAASRPRDATKPAKKTTQTRAKKADRKAKVQTPTDPPAADSTATNVAQRSGPGININLQIHISADSSPEQIDQIFASMAKHIYPDK